MAKKLKIVVAGYAVGFPLGGQVWMMLHYVLGLSRLGHEVLFLEDAGDWAYPFDPDMGYGGSDSSYGRRTVQEFFRRHAPDVGVVYRSDIEDRVFGMDLAELEARCAGADLFLNLSGVCPPREAYLRCRLRAVVDTDPVVTQFKIATDAGARDYFFSHDLLFTYGLNIPSGVPGVPLSGADWRPLLPPVVLDLWPRAAGPGANLTTIGTWDAEGRDMVIEGRKLSWRKKDAYEAIFDLPSRLPEGVLEMAMSGMKEEAGRYRAAGWLVRDGLAVSRDLEGYRDYVRASAGEFTVVKEVNAALQSGWFSDRSATYLASGRPVVTGDTGFGTVLPLGGGLFAFHDIDEAERAARIVLEAPQKCGAEARRIAEEFFDAEKVLTDLLRQAGLA